MQIDADCITDSAAGAGDIGVDFHTLALVGTEFIDRFDFSTVAAVASTGLNDSFSYIGTNAFTAGNSVAAMVIFLFNYMAADFSVRDFFA